MMCHRSRILILTDSAFKAASSSFLLNISASSILKEIMKLHLISPPQKMALEMSHTNILTCSIIYILHFHHFRVYSAPEKVTVAICRCFAVLQSPEKRKHRRAHHSLPSSMFLHCYLYMQIQRPQHLNTCAIELWNGMLNGMLLMEMQRCYGW